MVSTQLHTTDDLVSLASEGSDYEIIEGVLQSLVPPNLGHADVQGNILFLLKSHAVQNGLGKVVGEAGFALQRNPDTVLAPDVSFVSAERWPEITSGFVEMAPDLVVEIASPGNLPGEIERKVAIYLHAGVRSVWIVYPDEREVVVHIPTRPPRVYAGQDEIDGGDVLPGLRLPVPAIFS